MIKKIIVIAIPIVIIAVTIILLGNSIPNDFSAHDEFYPDTNVQSIELNKSITLGDEVYIITSVDIGDEYTVVRFDNDGLITGMELYQNDEKLEFVSATHSSFAGGAIAFTPANGAEELEIRIFKVKRQENVTYTYPLVFEDNKAIVEDTIEGVKGSIEIIMEEKTFRIEFYGSINDLLKAEVNGFPKKPGNHILLRNGEDIGSLGDVSYFEYPPDEIKISSTILELDDEQIIIPVS